MASLSFLNDENEILLEETKLDQKVIYKYNKLYIIFLFLFIISILILQSIMLYYFMRLGPIFDQLNNINTTNVNSYVNKTKVIIDYVCKNMIEC